MSRKRTTPSDTLTAKDDYIKLKRQSAALNAERRAVRRRIAQLTSPLRKQAHALQRQRWELQPSLDTAKQHYFTLVKRDRIALARSQQDVVLRQWVHGALAGVPNCSLCKLACTKGHAEARADQTWRGDEARPSPLCVQCFRLLINAGSIRRYHYHRCYGRRYERKQQLLYGRP